MPFDSPQNPLQPRSAFDKGLRIDIRRRACRAPRAISLVLIAAVLLGCGGADRPLTVPISGSVTLNKGAWPSSGTLFFLPLEPAPGLPRRAATAEFETDGVFATPSSWTEGDGVVPGRYKVFVECWKVRPTRAGPRPVGYTTPKYQSGATSDIEVEITEESADNTYQWDFPSSGA